ncbi:MAG: 1-phosphofructokinase family hexose kinase [Clostridia bacterium]|nr:1-phosphofructokinase family hexose kinase [Clostridia bacterium]
MIGTITLNPCVDKTLVIDEFTYGGMNRVIEKRKDISGKGVNVSIVLTQIGVAVLTFGIYYKKGSEAFINGLEEIGIKYKGIMADGELRENIKVLDINTNITTELNQKGDFIDNNILNRLEQQLEQVMDDIDVLVITGSVPQGVGLDYYRKLIEKANAKKIKCILDAEGELLLEGMKAKPYLIKPNLYEFETVFGLKTKTNEDMVEKCKEIISEGIEVVCLSMGERGAIIVDKNEAYICKPTSIQVKSTQGAGDSLVAGICCAIEKGLPICEMLKYGVSAAQGSLIREGTQLCTIEGFERFKEIVTVEKIEQKRK